MSPASTHSRTLAVVGAGTMGSGIAQKMATEGFTVLLADIDDASAARGVERIGQTLSEAVARGIFTTAQATVVRSRVRGTSRLEDLTVAELVVEAVFEDIAIKRDLFARLDRICDADTILATNTSSFSVTDLATATARPARVLGLHYFYHPAKNRLVEVVAGRTTDPAAFGRAWVLQELIGKTPIAARDSHGFIVNRFFAPWLVEAIRIVDEGVASIATVEHAAGKAFGIGMGPFELMNVTGLPIALHTANTLQQAFGPMYGPPDSLADRIRTQTPWPLEGKADEVRVEAVTDRLAGITFLVASALVDEQVGSIDDTDLGARVGLRWRRGPFELANQYGVRRAAALAGEMAERWNLPLPNTLARKAQTDEPFSFVFVRTTVADGIATITIDRPDALNALNEAVVEQLTEAFRAVANDPSIQGIVITGRGKAFVAGADIRFFIKNIEAGTLDRIVMFTRRGQALLSEIAASPKTVVARVHGMALGGGVELALACDAIVATPKASFAFPETGIGIYPGLGGTQRTTRRVGTGLTKWLVLTGQTLSAERALEIGLIDRVASDDALDAAIGAAIDAGPVRDRQPRPPSGEYRNVAEAFGRPVAELSGVDAKAPIALRIAGELIEQGATLPIDSALQLEIDRLVEIFATKDAYEGLTAIGRRVPTFTGQ